MLHGEAERCCHEVRFETRRCVQKSFAGASAVPNLRGRMERAIEVKREWKGKERKENGEKGKKGGGGNYRGSLRLSIY